MQLRTFDLVTIIVYFIFTMGIGFWFMRRTKSTDDYFKGGGKIPAWATGMSLLATAISSISFLGYPGYAFDKNWSLIIPGLMLPFAAVIGAFVFAPFYRGSRFTSAYEYLEGRFSPGVRMYAVFLYLIQQIWRLGSVLYLLSIPVELMTGWDPVWVILVVGVCTTVYCFVGGLEAVIWTDVIQTFVLLGGGIATVLIVFLTADVGPAYVFETAWENHKFNLTANTNFNFVQETIWVLIVFGLVQNVQEHVSDQIKVQRYCSVKDDTEAKKAVMFNGLLCIPVWCLFMFVGTCLYAFYTALPDPTVAGLEPDKVFPHFIISQMPIGLGGLVIAAVMAAAMSTLSSSMNSSATVLTVDIIKRYFASDRDDHYYLNIGRMMTVVGGVLMIVTALAISLALDQSSFLPISFFITSLTFGGLGGLFCIGFFSTRTSNRGMVVGIVATVLLTIYLALSVQPQVLLSGEAKESYEAWLEVKEDNPDAPFEADKYPGWFVTFHEYKSPTHKFMIGVLSNVAAFFVAYFASFLFARPPDKKIRKATFWTLKE